MKKHIVLYGAYDRYNYGDNLMPIIFRMYIEKYHSELLLDFEIKYSAISNSDLTKFACFKTKEVSSILDTTPLGSLLIVIGGEVLCATNLTLLLHVQNSRFSHFIVKSAKFFLGRYLTLITNYFYGTSWEFPYIPPKDVFKNKIMIAYNTIGGGVSGLKDSKKHDVIKRLKSADYISVRDNRTKENLNTHLDVELYPDSVFLISELISMEFLKSKVRAQVKSLVQKPYFCFQASPHKVGVSIDKIEVSLIEIAAKRNEKIVLLPIGYASGHDDIYFLEELNKRLNGKAIILTNLSVWEIMYVIRNANLFMGTSLHGIITAMAFGIPHIGLNTDISKVDSFLKDWSIAPFNKSIDLDQVFNIATRDFSTHQKLLKENSYLIAEKVKQNNSKILQLCY